MPCCCGARQEDAGAGRRALLSGGERRVGQRPSAAFADFGGVPSREHAARCIDALKAGRGFAPGDWIEANVPEPLRAWVADHVRSHIEMRTLAFVSRARAQLRIFPTRHPEGWVAANVPAYLQVGVMFDLLD